MATWIARDALHIALSFLHLNETAAAGRTCRSWHAAVETEPHKKNRNDWLLLKTDTLASAVASHLRRHITAIRYPSWQNRPQECFASDLELISHFPRLTRLSAVVPSDATVEQAALVIFPAQLRELQLTSSAKLAPLGALMLGALMLGALIQAMVVTVPRIASLHLDFKAPLLVDLTPLKQLTELASLQLRFRPSLSQIAVIRSLSSLRSLDPCFRSVASLLSDLCAPGHSLHQLDTLDQPSLSLANMKLLSTLPSLTSVRVGDSFDSPNTADALTLVSLHLIPRLKRVNLDFFREELNFRDNLPVLVPHVYLRELTLTELRISEFFLDTILASLAQLRVLHLNKVKTDSLAPLLHLLELHTLKVDLIGPRCHHPAWNRCSAVCELTDFDQHLAVLTSLHKLTSLDLQSLGPTRITVAQLLELSVPSVRLPRLVQFMASDRLQQHAKEYEQELAVVARKLTASTIAQDALHVVLSFLDICDTAAAGRTCRFWDVASRNEPSKQRSVGCFGQIDEVVASHLRRHVSAILMRDGQNFVAMQPSDELVQLCQLPNLTQLAVAPAVDDPLAAAVEFDLPTSLLRVRLDLSHAFQYPLAAQDASVRSLLRSPRLQRIHLKLPHHSADVDLTPLVQLSDLTDLRVGDVYELGSKMATAIRQMAGLKRLSINNGEMVTPELRLLCAPGHALNNLEMLDLSLANLDGEMVEVYLAALPSLTAHCESGLTARINVERPHLLPHVTVGSFSLMNYKSPLT